MPEGRNAERWSQAFLRTMAEQRFIPGGRILAAAGLDLDATLANCFVMGKLEDSIDGIFTALRESAVTLQAAEGSAHVDAYAPRRGRGREPSSRRP
jgi:ribonucleoside-diphosphate reductase alpha chain